MRAISHLSRLIKFRNRDRAQLLPALWHDCPRCGSPISYRIIARDPSQVDRRNFDIPARKCQCGYQASIDKLSEGLEIERCFEFDCRFCDAVNIVIPNIELVPSIIIPAKAFLEHDFEREPLKTEGVIVPHEVWMFREEKPCVKCGNLISLYL